MSQVPAAVQADAVVNTKNCRCDYSFFLLLVDVHHSTIRPTDLRLSASKSVAPQIRGQHLDAPRTGYTPTIETRQLAKSSVKCRELATPETCCGAMSNVI